jgi:hypothetical protein
MVTKTLTGTYSGGYSLAAKYDTVVIAPAAEIGGSGLILPGPATVENDGAIVATGNGVTAYAAATIVNGSTADQLAEIRGYSGVFAPNAAVTVSNFATIQGRGQYGDGVFLVAGGSVTNGASSATAAYISGDISGVTASAVATVVNFGTLKGFSADGVYLAAGGSVTNGSLTDPRATISGRSGIVSGAGAATIVNFRTISGFGTQGYGVEMIGGGQITNGAANDTIAIIRGEYAGVVSQALTTLINFGTIAGTKNQGVVLDRGGSVTNGAAADARATISGATGGIDAIDEAVTISNFATIAATVSGTAIYMEGGKVTNGSTLSQNAVIQGVDFGIVAITAGATIGNFGVIDAIGGETGPGAAVSLKAGGTITNGAATDTTAIIQGEGFGVLSSGLSKVVNFGTILGFNTLYLSGGASVTNGSAKDTTAAIVGYGALIIRDGVGTVANFGTIVSYGTRFGVGMFNQGSLANGSLADTAAVIDGGSVGVLIDGMAGTVSNFGTIQADLTSGGATGVYLTGGSLTNGAATDQTATIVGRTGMMAGAGASTTVTNFGTIDGFGGMAVYFGTFGDVLNVEAGSAFLGSVLGGAGTLDLASGVGTLAALTADGNVTVSGSMAKTTFQDFGTVEVGAGASFTDAGAASIGTSHTLLAAGVLTLAGAVKNAGVVAVGGGALTVDGVVTLAGMVNLDGGTADFASTFKQDVVFGAQGGKLELGRSQGYGGEITGFASTPACTLDLDDIAFTAGKTKASFSGSTSSGTLTVTDGAHTAKIALAGDYTGAKFAVADDGHGGTLVTDRTKAMAVPPTTLPLITAMAGFAGASATALPSHVPRVADRPILVSPRAAWA